MNTILTIINVAITIAALILCIRAWRGLRAVSQTQPCTVDKLSILAHRREELERASMAWIYTRERGLTNTERREEQVMERLEREVAALEKDLFHPKAEELVTPKVETPKPTPVIQVEFVGDDFFPDCYIITCSSCGWSWWGRSEKRAEAKRAEHEWAHA